MLSLKIDAVFCLGPVLIVCPVPWASSVTLHYDTHTSDVDCTKQLSSVSPTPFKTTHQDTQWVKRLQKFKTWDTSDLAKRVKYLGIILNGTKELNWWLGAADWCLYRHLCQTYVSF